MFTKLGPNAVVSDQGYFVERTGRHTLLYRAGDCFLEIEVEPGDGLAVYVESIRHWKCPGGAKQVTRQERDEIVANVSRALSFLKIKHIVSGST